MDHHPDTLYRALVDYDRATGWLDGLSEEFRCVALCHVLTQAGVRVGVVCRQVHIESPQLRQAGLVSVARQCFGIKFEHAGQWHFRGSRGEDAETLVEHCAAREAGGEHAEVSSIREWQPTPLVSLGNYLALNRDMPARAELERVVAEGTAALIADQILPDEEPLALRPSIRI